MEKNKNKNMNHPRIIFMGTPDFAVASLKALVEEGFNVVAVITAPDKPAGRGMQLQQSAVKKFALEMNIPVLQPEKLKNTDFLDNLRQFQADIQVVVAFRMLPEVVWNMPPLGTVNVHGSYLPQYRGAAPINWAIINGETETGVTTFKLQHEIDTGDLLLREIIPIGTDETAGELHDRMKETGAKLLVKTMHAIFNQTIEPVPQASEKNEIKHAPKIYKETCEWKPGLTRQQAHNLIRGLSPYPTAFTDLLGKNIKLFKSNMNISLPEFPGNFKWMSDSKKLLALNCADGPIALEEIQLEGKKRMNVEDFLRGFKLSDNPEVWMINN